MYGIHPLLHLRAKAFIVLVDKQRTPLRKGVVRFFGPQEGGRGQIVSVPSTSVAMSESATRTP